jgi:hydroxyacylglutathione hydrolase
VGFSDEHPRPLAQEGSGNSARLVDPGDGRALAVDVGQ